MYKDLSGNIKSSITRSITTTFEQYMANIQWDEDKFDLKDFIDSWKEYITTKASWYNSVPEDVKISPQFHEELAQKINQTIEKILSEPPSEQQIAEIEILQEKYDTHYEYACKAEASYVEQILKEKQKQE